MASSLNGMHILTAKFLLKLPKTTIQFVHTISDNAFPNETLDGYLGPQGEMGESICGCHARKEKIIIVSKNVSELFLKFC